MQLEQLFNVRFIERKVISEMFHNFVFPVCFVCCAVLCRVVFLLCAVS